MSDDGFARVGALAEIPEGEVRAFDLPVGRVAIAHVEHRLFAFADACTHAGCTLSDGIFDDRAATIICPVDETAFDVETGEPVSGPGQDALPIYAVREVGGWVEVSLLPRP
ncbi:MAG TPA: Rieske 2Fe-2S domain-containing protein [Actinomycetota bacterium]|nr:Rieske 2Fe-2S domain-containing protein [Actinomycetota bacterium]